MTIGGCGSRITGKARSDLPLEIGASVPHEPLSAENALLLAQIEMRVTNLTDSALRVSTNGSGADMTVAKNGIVVATPAGRRDAGVTFPLEPGASRAYKSTVSLRRCDSSPSGSIDPGRYELYAVQPFFLNLEATCDRSPIVVQGGPWDIEVGQGP